MAKISLVSVQQSEARGYCPAFGEGFVRASERNKLLLLGDDAEISVSGLPHGMQSGKPSVALGFVLPDGRHVLAEMSWRLFAGAFWYLAAQFGDDVRPDGTGMAIEYDATGDGKRVHLDLRDDSLPNVFECEICGERRDEPPGQEGSAAILQFVHRHYREKHPDWTPPA